MKFTTTCLLISLQFLLIACVNSESSNTPVLNQENSDHISLKKVNQAPVNPSLVEHDVYKKVIPKEKPQSLKELEGVYTKSGHKKSWLMAVKVNNNTINTTLYEVKGILPSDGSFVSQKIFQNSIIEQIKLTMFEVNLANLSFESDFGPGDLTGNLMVFLRYYDLNDKPLSLYRDPEFDVLLKH